MIQHSEEIHLNDKLVSAISDGSNDARALFIKELSNAQEIKCILASYDYLSESKGQVNEFIILPDSVAFRTNGEGSFKVTYYLEFFYACDAITTKHLQKMTVTFKLNLEIGRALFSGEVVSEREPDEL